MRAVTITSYASQVQTTAAGLARITVTTPRRRLDVALPGQAPLGELLPELLRHAGEAGGVDAPYLEWVLRRADGAVLATGRGLHAQGVRDGDVLQLMPATVEWPEVGYDDVAAAVAAGAGRQASRWSPAASSAAALAASGLLLAAGVGLAVDRMAALGPWPPSLVAAALLVAAVTAARRGGQWPGAVLLAGAALPFGAVAGAGWAPSELGLVGGAGAWLLVASVAAVGLGGGSWVVAAGVTVGVLALPGALLSQTPAGLTGAAAVLACVLVCGTGALPPVALWLARLPQPPAGAAVMFPAVARADRLLTGALAGWVGMAVLVVGVLVATGGPAAWVLSAVTALALLARARLFVAVRHRVPLLAGGVLAGAAAAWALVTLLPGPAAPVLLAAVVAAGVLLAAAGSARPPVGLAPARLPEVLDTVAVVAVVPLAAWTLDLYAAVAAL